MKPFFLPLISLLFFSSLFGQQFSFQINFEDAAGNKDSLILGYDQQGTDTLDAIFNETNIIGMPYSNGLDVRVGNDFMKIDAPNIFGSQTSFQSKKQIVPDSCGSSVFSIFQLIEIDILTAHWPVKAAWNSSYFNGSCRNGSVFTGVHPGGWWDTGGFRAELKNTDSIIFLPNFYYYLDGNDTMRTYWAAFSDSTLLALAVNEISGNTNPLIVYPSPATDEINLKIPSDFGKVLFINFYNNTGQHILTSKKTSEIEINFLLSGLYFLAISNEKGNIFKTKFLKN